jgi:hypothetical protein
MDTLSSPSWVKIFITFESTLASAQLERQLGSGLPLHYNMYTTTATIRKAEFGSDQFLYDTKSNAITHTGGKLDLAMVLQ